MSTYSFVTSAKTEVMESDRSVSDSVCVQEYCKSNQPNSLKFGAMIGPTSWKNCLTFGGDPVPDTDSRSLFRFPRHCGIGDFRRFIRISRSHRLIITSHDTQRND